MSYEGAFQCSKCPRSNDKEAPRACPAWWESMVRDSLDGQMRLEKSCAFTQLPNYFMEVLRASGSAAAEASKMANSAEKLIGEIRGKSYLFQSNPTYEIEQSRSGRSLSNPGHLFQPTASTDQPSGEQSIEFERGGGEVAGEG